MELSDLTVEVRDVNLVRRGQVEDRFLDCKLEPRYVAPGAWSLKLPNEHPMVPYLLEPGSGIIVTHTDPAVGVLLSGPQLSPARTADQTDPQGTTTFTGTTDDVILWRRLAYPTPSTALVTAQAIPYDVRTGAAETVMRAYVNANVGPGAPAARKVAALTLAADLARGGAISYSARFDNLGELLASIATRTGLGFRVVQIGAGLQFQVYDPTDKSALIRLDMANGTLASQSVTRSAPTLTRAIVAGQGEQELRTFVEVATTTTDEADYGMFGRIEGFVDQRNTNDPTELAQAGLEAVLDGASGLVVKAVPGDDQTMNYPQDWGLGDVLGLVVDSTEAKAQVTAVPIIINASVGVRIGASIGDVTGWDPQAGIRKEVADQDSRLSLLERTSETSPTPVGTMVEYAGLTPPTGWLLCDGSAISRTLYADLFAVLGTRYGAGNGTTTFNLPNEAAGQYLHAEGTSAQTGTTATPLRYDGMQLVVPAGTWEIQGGIQGQSNVLDAQTAELYDATNAVAVPNSRGGVQVIGAPPAAQGAYTRAVAVTLAVSTVFKVRLVPNGSSIPSVIGAGIAGGPAAWLDAKSLPYNRAPSIIKF